VASRTGPVPLTALAAQSEERPRRPHAVGGTAPAASKHPFGYPNQFRSQQLEN